MEETHDWHSFWNNWRSSAGGDQDLYFEVGRTVNKKPIGREILDKLITNIISRLQLDRNDVLVDLCCGNGLCTFELRNAGKQIIGVDFTRHLIESARQNKSAPQIDYLFENIFDFLANFKSNFDIVPTKYLMNFSLGYFAPADLEKILEDIISISGTEFKFLLTEVPDDSLKWNFYNTEERKCKYLENVAKGDTSNGGLGRWWNPDEIRNICQMKGLKCEFFAPDFSISNYRMDIMITG